MAYSLGGSPSEIVPIKIPTGLQDLCLDFERTKRIIHLDGCPTHRVCVAFGETDVSCVSDLDELRHCADFNWDIRVWTG